MNKKLIPLFLLASTSLLTACNQDKVATTDSGLASATVAKEDAIAVVNGKYISKTSLASLESEIAKSNGGQSIPKEKFIEELIRRELLIQEAVQKKLNETPEYTKQLDTLKASLLTQAAVQNFFKSNPVTDADLKAEYDKNVADSGTEYKARHILVKSEEDAKQIITELSGGTDFAELAKTKSTGPSGPKGGDLGWFASGQMVAPFSEAVIALADNKFTLVPVKTQFGYHVILREGSRAKTPPPFESIKEQIRPMLQRKKLQGFLEGLREQAKVEILLPATVVATPEAPAETNATKSTVDKVSTKISETASQAKEILTDTTTSTVDKIKSATDTAKNTANKATEAVKSAAGDVKAIATDVIEKADNTVSEKATKTLDALTQ